MELNRSGYYKWKKRKGTLNRYEQRRYILISLLRKVHLKHPSYGYHRLAKILSKLTDFKFSDNLIHKCCMANGIHSKARKCTYKKHGNESLKFPNKIKGKWNADHPLQIVVSDMTVFKNKGRRWEWTILLDTFNNEILAHQATPIVGNSKPYYYCLDRLKQLIEKRKEQTSPVVLHTDQGAVYSSRAFCQAHKDYNIDRSMSRGGTPTDNPIIEALNGWIKEELFLDYNLSTAENVPLLLDEYVEYFNHKRPAAALNYKSLVQYKTELGF